MESSMERAFQISLIFSEIWRLLSFNDKKTFRLICRLCRDISLVVWRKEVVLVLRSDEKFFRTLRGTFERDKRGIATFYKNFLRNNDGFESPSDSLFHAAAPITSVKMSENSICLPGSPSTETFMEEKLFWKYSGPVLEQLKLLGCATFKKGQLNEGLKWVMVESCVNLKELAILGAKMEFDCEGKIKIDDPLPVSISSGSVAVAEALVSLTLTGFSHDFEFQKCREILEIVPNIKKLKLDYTTAFGFLDALRISRIKLEELELNLPSLKIDGESLQNFTMLRDYIRATSPPLKTIKLWLNFKVIKMDFQIQEFLADCGSTLEKLEMTMDVDFVRSRLLDWNQNYFWFSILNEKRFQKLTHLKLNFNEDPKSAEFVKFDFRCLREMPSLKVLLISSPNVTGRSNVPPTSATLERFSFTPPGENIIGLQNEMEMKCLERFHFSLWANFTEEDFKILYKWMRSLKTLELVLDETTLPIVLQLWKKLDKLVLLVGSKLDIVELFNNKNQTKPTLIRYY